MKIETLEDLLADELKDLYSAENQLIRALPKMAKTAKSAELRMAFEEHLEQTKNHAQRIEQVCTDMGVSPKGKKCVGMEGLIEEGREIITNGSKDSISPLEAGLIGAAQKVEHYEICAYGGLVALANTLGLDEVSDLLNQTLQEEKETDMLLSNLAETLIGDEAKQEAEAEK